MQKVTVKGWFKRQSENGGWTEAIALSLRITRLVSQGNTPKMFLGGYSSSPYHTPLEAVEGTTPYHTVPIIPSPVLPPSPLFC